MHQFHKFFILSNLHVSNGLSVHHQELKTVIQQQVYVKQRLLSEDERAYVGTLCSENSDNSKRNREDSLLCGIVVAAVCWCAIWSFSIFGHVILWFEVRAKSA